MGKVRFVKTTVLHETFYNVDKEPQHYDGGGDYSGDYCPAEEHERLREVLGALVEACNETLGYVDVTFCYESDWTPLMREKFNILPKAIAAAKEALKC